MIILFDICLLGTTDNSLKHLCGKYISAFFEQGEEKGALVTRATKSIF